MAQPLYFLPNCRRTAIETAGRLNRSFLQERGIDRVFADVDGAKECSISELAGRGPGDQSGVILAYQSPETDLPRRIGYYPKEQWWEQVGELLWVGIDTAEPPTPEDLRRKVQHNGYRHTLAGAEWLIPVIRRPDKSTELPCSLKWDAAGNVITPIKQEYRGYWEASAEICKWFFADDDDEGDKPKHVRQAEALDFAVRALGLNYRFGRSEQNLLEPIDAGNVMEILALTVDLPSVLSAKKKGGEVAANLKPGGAASSATIDPPAAS